VNWPAFVSLRCVRQAWSRTELTVIPQVCALAYMTDVAPLEGAFDESWDLDRRLLEWAVNCVAARFKDHCYSLEQVRPISRTYPVPFPYTVGRTTTPIRALLLGLRAARATRWSTSPCGCFSSWTSSSEGLVSYTTGADGSSPFASSAMRSAPSNIPIVRKTVRCEDWNNQSGYRKCEDK
jgi:hypothetical protein